jgi:hypothetical protein
MILSRVRLLMIFGVLMAVVGTAAAFQEVRETVLIGTILKKNTNSCHQILRSTHAMREQAIPFLKPKYQAKFRFQPEDKHTRRIMSLARTIKANLDLLGGVLYHADVPNRDQILNAARACTETMTTASKRALRAIRDHNHELYLVSAETTNREALNLNRLLLDMENSINASIEKGDDARENL